MGRDIEIQRSYKANNYNYINILNFLKILSVSETWWFC